MSTADSALYGACACERNQYTILVPASASSQAHVFFDNSAANRRSQATPLTAWLRVPLAWYHSRTFALFPDETHHSIRRTFHTPSPYPASRANGGSDGVVRRQFCGYCGTHLSAWDEGQEQSRAGAQEDARSGGDGGEGEEWMDITLGSLLDESLRELEALGILSDSEDEVSVPSSPANPADVDMTDTSSPVRRRDSQASTPMRHRGLPFFESMVENSRLGRIKRQKGGHTSSDGRRTVEWEVVEIEGGGEVGEEGEAEMGGESRIKRPRLGT